MKKLFSLFGMLVLMPVFVQGQTVGTVDASWITNLIAQATTVIGLLIPLVIFFGLLIFIWGLVQFIASSGDDAAKEEGKRKMIWGIIALFVIVAVWGFVAVLADIFGVTIGEDLTNVPTVVVP